ncbi:MAG: hypothetical protein JOZ50_08770 [Candidatus Eremiobacteraeota bacterium]|nr:hypothetical protein [Candidatus Eremiobacteraeota bacterium]
MQEGEVVGFIMFAQVEPWLYEIRTVVSLREGLGVASFALAWTLEHLFRQRAAHRVYLEVLRAINARAAYTNGMALSWKGPIETVIAPHSNEKACFRS